MSARETLRIRRGASASVVDYSTECLSRLARVLVRCGHSPNALARDFATICSSLKEPARCWDPTQPAFLADLPHVIALWNSDPSYLDARGAPIALPLRGRAPSLSALIERVLPGEEPGTVAKCLARMQGIRRRGHRYVATGRHLSYRRDVGRAYSLNALLRMLCTVERNLAGARKSAILERSAIHPNFPVNALPAFHSYLKTWGLKILWNIDTDMRLREAESTTGPRTRLGVELFAFEEPRIAARRLSVKHRVARRANRGRGLRQRSRKRKP
jgi:hypothetical protein